jgi:hypothetical protein
VGCINEQEGAASSVKRERNEEHSIRHMSDAFEIDGITVTAESVKVFWME